MTAFTITPNMGMNNPTVSVDPGPDYATNISGDIVIIDNHNHTSGKGLAIPSAGLNINADLSFNSRNLTSLRSARLANNGSPISGVGDVDCVYVSGNNLYYNNSSGTAIQLTSGSAPVSTTSSNFQTVITTTNLTISSSDTTTFIDAKSDANTVQVTLPAANAVVAGRFYWIKDRSGSSQTHNITIVPVGADTIDGAASITIAQAYLSYMIVSDGISRWMAVTGNRTIYFAGENFQFTGGAQLTMDASSAAVFGSTIQVSGVTTLNGAVVLGSASLAWANTVVTPIISQATTAVNSATGNVLTVQAQSASGTSSIGGALQLKPGTGTGANGAVNIMEAGGNTKIRVTSTGIGFYNHSAAAQQAITGSLSTVADAPAKAVLTSIINALVATGLVINSTT